MYKQNIKWFELAGREIGTCVRVCVFVLADNVLVSSLSLDREREERTCDVLV